MPWGRPVLADVAGAAALRLILCLWILFHHLFTKLHASGRYVYIGTAAKIILFIYTCIQTYT